MLTRQFFKEYLLRRVFDLMLNNLGGIVHPVNFIYYDFLGLCSKVKRGPISVDGKNKLVCFYFRRNQKSY